MQKVKWKLKDNLKDYIIFAKEITYLKNQEKIFTVGQTNALIEQNLIYNKKSYFFRDEMKLNSSKNTKILDNEFTSYELDKFEYLINEKTLKGKNVKIITNYNKPEIEREFYNFKDGMFLDTNFIASDTKIKIRKNTFNEDKNDPRVRGVSSKKMGILPFKTKLFYELWFEQTKRCPPWSIKADKNNPWQRVKKKILTSKSVLRIYDVASFLFFQKFFFHPDPSVERQSGLLQPRIE